jgi:hypothetical protein
VAAGGPLALQRGSSDAGYPVAGSGPNGVTIRFIDRGSFWVAALLRNTSSRPITVESARTLEPADSLVRETGSAFSPYSPCSGMRVCLFPPISPPPSTAPLMVAPGHYFSIKFNYRLVSCAAAHSATTASGDQLRVSYQTSGRSATQTFARPSERLRLLRPAGIECLARPFSHIGLVGSFTTSPGHKPMPGSDGDTCTRTRAGGLAFQSRTFFDRLGTAFTVSINLPRFHGIGSYGHSHSRPLGQAQVTARGGFGNGGFTTFTDNSGSVTVTTAGRRTIGGRFDAVFSGHRRLFRGYGAWRCTVIW